MNIEQQKHIIYNKISKKSQNGYIKSPINYTGNKFRILDQMIPYMPKKIGTMVDLFSGGATVGLNIDADKVIFIDSNKRIINLLETIAEYDFDSLLTDILKIIDLYGLSLSCVYGYKTYKDMIVSDNVNNGLKEYNKNQFYRLREDYNKISDKSIKKANIILYLLMVYGFNNDIRFSKEGNFNLPIGKTDFNLNNAFKLYMFIKRTKKMNFEFIHTEFNSKVSKQIVSTADFVYMDPPYLITTAVYNESNQWNNQKEYQLLDFVEELLSTNKNFMLSNIIEKRSRRNEPLYYWTEKQAANIEIIDINYHYRGASYNKKNRDDQEREIIIVPRVKK